MTHTRIFIAALAIGAGFASTGLASERQRPAHAKEFYARAPNEALFEESGVASAAARPDCFVSYTPTEVTRGIRHWTGKCH